MIFKSMDRSVLYSVWVALLAFVPLISSPAAADPGKTPETSTSAPNLNLEDRPLDRDIRAGTSYATVAKKVAGSVVNIYSTTIVRHPFVDDPLFRRFFGGDGSRMPRDQKAQGLGSGVIVSPDGYILTANHVVEGADSIKVALGEEKFDAKIIGTDAPTDVAVLKIEAPRTLPAIKIANSDHLEVGDVVLAIGNPFGLGQTVTMGIVSAVDRGGLGITDYENFIQTDAAINQGNSGGPLVDAEGRLVGINTAILSRSGGFQGVGLAVPANMAVNVLNQLIAKGQVSRGFLGINIQPLTPELAKAFQLPGASSGVLVGGVTPGSAAQNAGVKDGDLIVAFNGKTVTDPRSLQLAVSQTPPGSKFNVKVLRVEPGRKPAERTLSAMLDELPQDVLTAGEKSPSRSQPKSEYDALDGVEIADLDSRLRREFDIPNSVRGAIVSNVDPSSNAAEAGLRVGEVILELNRKPVQSADQAVELSEKATGDTILLRVWSKNGPGAMGGTRYVAVDNQKRK